MPLPNRPEKIAQRWLNRGLTFLSLGNGLYWSKSQGWSGAISYVGGPKKSGSTYGVLFGFGATVGTGTTDMASGPDVLMAKGWRSIVSFSYPITAGSASLGRVFAPRNFPAATGGEAIFPVTGGNTGYAYTLGAATFYQWTVTPAISGLLNRWNCVGITHDQTTTGVLPLSYLSGVAQTAAYLGGSGAYNTANWQFDTGNRQSDGARGWDGYVGLQAFFDHPTLGLSADEHAKISADPSILFDGMSDDVYGFDTAVTVYRPGSDVVVAGWTGTPDNVNLYTNIDEASASDSDYVTSPNIDGSQGPLIGGLTASVPVGTWDVKYRSDYNVGAAKQVRMTLLDSSNVSVGAGAWQTVTTSFVLYTSTITTTGVATRFKIEVQ